MAEEDEHTQGMSESDRGQRAAADEPAGRARPAEVPLPPLVRLGPCVRPVAARLAGVGVLVGIGVLLYFAAWKLGYKDGPSRPGQTMMPPCGFLVTTGYPCPTCGMTRAFQYVVRGRLVAGLKSQPMGALLCVAMILAIPAALVVLVTGRGWQVDWYRVRPDRLLWVLLAVFLAAWGYKLIQAWWAKGP